MALAIELNNRDAFSWNTTTCERPERRTNEEEKRAYTEACRRVEINTSSCYMPGGKPGDTCLFGCTCDKRLGGRGLSQRTRRDVLHAALSGGSGETVSPRCAVVCPRKRGSRLCVLNNSGGRGQTVPIGCLALARRRGGRLLNATTTAVVKLWHRVVAWRCRGDEVAAAALQTVAEVAKLRRLRSPGLAAVADGRRCVENNSGGGGTPVSPRDRLALPRWRGCRLCVCRHRDTWPRLGGEVAVAALRATRVAVVKWSRHYVACRYHVGEAVVIAVRATGRQ